MKSLFRFCILVVLLAVCSSIAWGECGSAPFMNRQYSPECLRRLGDGTLPKALNVVDGYYDKNPDMGDFYFDVEEVHCTDLDGDGAPEAMVTSVCGLLGANYTLPEYFVFAGPPAYAKLLDSISDERIHADFKRYDDSDMILWPLQEAVFVKGGGIDAWFYAGGPHCCPEKKVTLHYVLREGKLAPLGTPRVESVE